MNTVLAVTGAKKAYGSTQALDGATVSLHDREWLALLGPNGAGKTTLIRAIAGRALLNQGTVTLLGHDLDDAKAATEARRQLGIVPQDLALYPLLTAEENLLAFGTLHGVPKRDIRQRVKWALEWTGLADRAESLSKTFSGGMKRRLNIACAVLHQPKVVLLDEPTVGVDPQSRERIWAMLEELRSQGAALLLTTHQLDEAQQVCDRITIIDHGKTIADGTMDQLVAGTVGRSRRVTLVLDRPVANGMAREGTASADGTSIAYSVEDVARELPPLIERFAAAGCRVEDVQIERPSLHAVFIHLTGRELRES
jgi:ABC-2 type transport system ATP-binding protein